MSNSRYFIVFMTKKPKIIIKGVTEEGQTFRPSDWAERWSGGLATFRNHRITYSPQLQPIMREGNKCVLLDPELEKTNPELYRSIIDFAHANHLKICGEEQDEQEDPLETP
jgi:hypothetical protein